MRTARSGEGARPFSRAMPWNDSGFLLTKGKVGGRSLKKSSLGKGKKKLPLLALQDGEVDPAEEKEPPAKEERVQQSKKQACKAEAIQGGVWPSLGKGEGQKLPKRSRPKQPPCCRATWPACRRGASP